MPSSGQVSSGPPRIPWVGQLFQFRRDPVGFLTKLARTYGDLVPFTLGSQPVLLLNHPEYFNQVLVVDHRNFVKAPGMERSKGLLGEGLLTSEGDFHLRQRRLAQPAFHRQRLPGYGAAMTEYGLRMRDQWQDGHTVDMNIISPGRRRLLYPARSPATKPPTGLRTCGPPSQSLVSGLCPVRPTRLNGRWIWPSPAMVTKMICKPSTRWCLHRI